MRGAIEFPRVFASFSTAKTEVMPRDSMMVYNFSSLLENFRCFHVLLSFFLSLGHKKPRFFSRSEPHDSTVVSSSTSSPFGSLHFSSLFWSSALFFSYWFNLLPFLMQSISEIDLEVELSEDVLIASTSSAHIVWYKRYGEFLGIEYQVCFFFSLYV